MSMFIELCVLLFQWLVAMSMVPSMAAGSNNMSIGTAIQSFHEKDSCPWYITKPLGSESGTKQEQDKDERAAPTSMAKGHPGIPNNTMR